MNAASAAQELPADAKRPNTLVAFAGGTLIGVLGGLIGLGGAEFRLPLLIGIFRFAALQAVILNKAMSLIVVAFALPFRTSAVPFGDVAAHWPIVLNLLAGTLLGAWVGAGWATRIASRTLYRTIAILLLIIAMVLLFGHEVQAPAAIVDGTSQVLLGVIAGLAIGLVAALMGVAGGELLIPTLILLFGVDVKLAGSLSLVVSLPTMLVGFARYSKDSSFIVLRNYRHFAIVMASGSIFGALIGSQMLGWIPSDMLIPLLTVILIASAIKVARHH